MSKILHVLAIIASMHGAMHCPDELTPSRGAAMDAPATDYDRTQIVEAGSDLKPFCRRKPEAVICRGHIGRQLTFKEVKRVDAEYRAVFQYRTPEASYGRYMWDNWSVCGNCSEYALTLSELLALDGEDGRDMHFMLVLQCDQTGCDGHARLWVRTSDKGIAEVDNQHAPDAPHWTEGEYEGYITMDGHRHVVPMPGWSVSYDEFKWSGK